MVTRRDSQLLVFQDFFFFLYFSTDNFAFLAFHIAIPRYRNFHHFLALWWARNNFGAIFSFVYTVSVLFTFHVLVAYGGPLGAILKIFIFRKRLNSQS